MSPEDENNEGFTPEQLAFAASGMPEAVLQWLAAVRANDVEQVWRGLSPSFRLWLAQRWITDNPAAVADAGLTRDAFAESLALEAPTHPLWVHCARVSLRALRSGLAGIESPPPAVRLMSHVMAPGLELVQLMPPNELESDGAGGLYLRPGQTVLGVALVLQHESAGWSVASIGDRLPIPGWPPTWDDLGR